jgi:hypothetical protein
MESLSSREKFSVNAEYAKERILLFLSGLDADKLQAFVDEYDIPEEATKDPETRAKIRRWLIVLPELPRHGAPEKDIKKLIALLERLFK